MTAEGAAEREIAGKIEKRRPGWIVIWGVYTKKFVAIPLFDNGKVTAAESAQAFLASMEEIERRAAGSRRTRERPQR